MYGSPSPTLQQQKYGSYGNAGRTTAELGTQVQGCRLVRFTGAPPVAQLCASGQEPDAVSLPQHGWSDPFGVLVLTNPSCGFLRCPGMPVVVEAGGAFTSGASLQSDSSGRVILHAGGPVIMRALEASAGSGSLVWAVFSR